MQEVVATRILLADDHAVVRRGLRLVLESESDFRVVSEVGDGADAVREAMRDDVDLAILDITMPRMSGLQAARELARLRPQLRILMLSVHDNRQYFLEALRSGACGYVLKSVADQDLIRACRLAMRDQPFIYPESERSLLRYFSNDDDEAAAKLTPREVQILALIADGHTSREIATLLVISPRTVDRHRENLFAKLGVHNRTQLTRYAIRKGLISP